jgi:tetratricopeptide (TPR) repeat protein
MAVLVYLATRRGAVVGRNELLDAVWPRMAVTHDALSQCIVELRRAFGDDSKQRRFIETIPKVGVRLIPPVWPLASAEPAMTPVASPTPARPSMFRTGIAGRFAVATCLLVAMAVAVWLLGNGSTPPASIGSRAAAETPAGSARDFYLSGDEYLRRTNRAEALRYEEEQYRRAVTEDPTFAAAWAKLSRTHAAFHWYGIDRSPGRCALAEQAIRRALTLDPELPEAHLYFANYEHRCRDDQRRALDEFAIAEQSIPDNAELHYLRSSVYRRLGNWELALANGARAVELDERNAVYRRQLYVSHLFLRRYDGAEEILDRLRALYPDDGTLYLDKVMLALARDGDTELAQRYDETPPTADYQNAMGYTYTHWLAALFDRDYDRALRILATTTEDPVLDGDRRESRIPKDLFYARTYALAGHHEEARRAFEAVNREVMRQLDRQIEEDPRVTQALRLALAEASVGVGQHERAREIADAALEMPETASDALPSSSLRLAYLIRVLIPLGALDEAVNELDAYFNEPGIWSIEGLLADPRLEPLHDEPRFEALVAKYRR